MSIEHNLRSASNKVQTDPYWSSVNLLLRTSGSSTILNNRTIVDETGNTASFTYGQYVRFGASNPSSTNVGSYYNLGNSQFSGGIKTGTNSSVNFPANFTVEYWAMVPAGTSFSGFPSPIISSTNYGFFANGPVSAKWVASGQYSGASWKFYSTITSNDGVWRHMALVRNGTGVGNLKFYIDGVNIPGDATTLATAYNATFSWSGFNIGCGVGNGPGAGDNQFFGYLANMRFSDVARYTSDFTPQRTPFTIDSNTKFLSKLQGAFFDVSNNKIPLLQQRDYPNELVQNSSIQKFPGYNSVQGTGGNYTSLSLPLNLLAYSPATNIIYAGDFTVECWAYVASSTTQNATSLILDSNSLAGTGLQLCTNFSSYSINNTFGCVLGYGTAALNSGVNCKDSTWHHLAVVRSGTTVTLFVDGVSTATATFVTSINFNSALMMGQSLTSGTQMIGYIDEIRMTGGVARYTSTFTPPTQPFPTS